MNATLREPRPTTLQGVIADMLTERPTNVVWSCGRDSRHFE